MSYPAKPAKVVDCPNFADRVHVSMARPIHGADVAYPMCWDRDRVEALFEELLGYLHPLAEEEGRRLPASEYAPRYGPQTKEEAE